MCIVFSIIERVYWYLKVTLSSMIVGESSYVSFLGPSLLCIHFVSSFVREWDEWPYVKGSRSLSFPSLHSLLMWLHSMFDLSWSSLLFVYSLFRSHLHHCLWFIPFASLPCSFLTLTYSRFDIFLASSSHISLSVRFSSFVSLLILYSHWAPSSPWFTSFSIHVAFHTWGHEFWSLGIWA